MNTNEVIILPPFLRQHLGAQAGQRHRRSQVQLLPAHQEDRHRRPRQAPRAIEAVKKDPKALAKWGGSVPKNLKSPLRDGDEEKDDENYLGCFFLNANAAENRRPRIIDRACNEVLDQEEVYSGCYANVKVGLFAYSASGNKGIGAGLEVIQKVRDGERCPAAAASRASRY